MISYQIHVVKRIDEVVRTTWATKVKNLLFKFGFGNVWLSHEVGDVSAFLMVFKQRIIHCMNQEWHSEISDSRKAIRYKHFKSLLNVERYLQIDILQKYILALSRCRC